MSNWRLDLQELHRMGGYSAVMYWSSTPQGRRELLDLGLVRPDCDRPAKSKLKRYRITQRGIDLIDGRLMRIHRGHAGPAVWRRAWWHPLPRANEIRLQDAPR